MMIGVHVAYLQYLEMWDTVHRNPTHKHEILPREVLSANEEIGILVKNQTSSAHYAPSTTFCS